MEDGHYMIKTEGDYMDTHKEVKRKILKYRLSDVGDHIRSFGSHNWTDIQLNPIKKKLSINSKYIMPISKVIEGQELVLYRGDLMYIVKEIEDRFVNRPNVDGYDIKRNRVMAHYLGDGKLQIGNKLGENMTIDFELLTLDKLLYKTDYNIFMESLTSVDRHASIQSLLIDLGRCFNLGVKVAQDNRSQKVNGIELVECASLTVDSLNLFDLEENISYISKDVKKKINYIDVIWFNTITKQVTDAFEVELSENHELALLRLAELEKKCIMKGISVRLIIISKERDKRKIERIVWLPTFRNMFTRNNLYFLSLESIAEIFNSKSKSNQKLKMYYEKLKTFIEPTIIM
jgi:hypothetical protein